MNSGEGEILFARRVSWIGNKPKDRAGDCVIIKFRDPGVVNHILAWGGPRQQGSITPLHLGHFYLHSRYLSPQGFAPLCNRGARMEYNIPVENRFNALDNVD